MKTLSNRELEEIDEVYYDYWHKYPNKGVHDFYASMELSKLLKELEIEKCDELLEQLIEEV
jgi:hypothetical protein